MIVPGLDLGGRYRIVRLLGEGAMGAVYEAEHVLIGKRVAVKVLHERFSQSAEALARFHREARAAAAIGHPHIVDVLDFGSHDTRPFLVMELLRGETLAERMATSEPLPPSATCRIIGEVLSALSAAHAIGVIHRDLKPENVILTHGNRSKLLDFGVSKFRESAQPMTTRTREGMMLGTPGYIAPEQWIGAAAADHRADLFSVGVILYEMLTGGLPYEGSTPSELYQEIVHGDAPPPAPSAIAPEAPSALDAIALRAVERDPSRRFQSAEEFLAALIPHGAAASTGRYAPPASPEHDLAPRITQREAATLHDLTERPEQRGPLRLTLVALAAALLLATTAVIASRSRNAPAVQTTTDAPALQTAITAPAVQTATDAPAVQTTTDAPAVQTTTDAPRAATPSHPRPARHVRTRVTHRW